MTQSIINNTHSNSTTSAKKSTIGTGRIVSCQSTSGTGRLVSCLSQEPKYNSMSCRQQQPQQQPQHLQDNSHEDLVLHAIGQCEETIMASQQQSRKAQEALQNKLSYVLASKESAPAVEHQLVHFPAAQVLSTLDKSYKARRDFRKLMKATGLKKACLHQQHAAMVVNAMLRQQSQTQSQQSASSSSSSSTTQQSTASSKSVRWTQHYSMKTFVPKTSLPGEYADNKTYMASIKTVKKQTTKHANRPLPSFATKRASVKHAPIAGNRVRPGMYTTMALHAVGPSTQQSILRRPKYSNKPTPRRSTQTQKALDEFAAYCVRHGVSARSQAAYGYHKTLEHPNIDAAVANTRLSFVSDAQLIVVRDFCIQDGHNMHPATGGKIHAPIPSEQMVRGASTLKAFHHYATLKQERSQGITATTTTMDNQQSQQSAVVSTMSQGMPLTVQKRSAHDVISSSDDRPMKRRRGNQYQYRYTPTTMPTTPLVAPVVVATVNPFTTTMPIIMPPMTLPLLPTLPAAAPVFADQSTVELEDVEMEDVEMEDVFDVVEQQDDATTVATQAVVHDATPIMSAIVPAEPIIVDDDAAPTTSMAIVVYQPVIRPLAKSVVELLQQFVAPIIVKKVPISYPLAPIVDDTTMTLLQQQQFVFPIKVPISFVAPIPDDTVDNNDNDNTTMPLLLLENGPVDDNHHDNDNDSPMVDDHDDDNHDDDDDNDNDDSTATATVEEDANEDVVVQAPETLVATTLQDRPEEPDNNNNTQQTLATTTSEPARPLRRSARIAARTNTTTGSVRSRTIVQRQPQEPAVPTRRSERLASRPTVCFQKFYRLRG